MRTRVALLALFLGSCTDVSVESDADLDASIESDAGFDAAPSPIEPGTYALEWTCVRFCVTDLPIAYTDFLVVDGAVATFTRSGCVECPEPGTTVETTRACAAITAISGGSKEYVISACGTRDGVTGTVQYDGYPGPAPAVREWRFVGSRI